MKKVVSFPSSYAGSSTNYGHFFMSQSKNKNKINKLETKKTSTHLQFWYTVTLSDILDELCKIYSQWRRDPFATETLVYVLYPAIVNTSRIRHIIEIIKNVISLETLVWNFLLILFVARQQTIYNIKLPSKAVDMDTKWYETVHNPSGPSGRCGNKLRTYALFKTDFEAETYCKKLLPLRHRAAFVSFSVKWLHRALKQTDTKINPWKRVNVLSVIM